MPAPKDSIKRKIWIENMSRAKIGTKNPDQAERMRQLTGDKHPAWKEKIYKTCPVCGGSFEVVPSKEDHKCCSDECKWKLHSERMTKPKVHKVCPVCKIDFDVTPCCKDQKCCSQDCSLKLFSGENHPSYIDGRSYEPYPIEFNPQLKESIRTRDGHRCQKCGLPEVAEVNGWRLPIHHIDGDKDNNSRNNLITLCLRCNIKVNTNRKKWTRYFQNKLERGRKQEQLCLVRL